MVRVTVRARFAPSPTGFLHVGSANTALKNWLFARSVGGTFVLRIEDTDVDRSKPELIDEILRTLEWLGIDWDEGPFLQSQRTERHAEAVQQLLRDGWAYEDDGAVRFRVPDEGVTGWDDVIRGRVEFENVNLEDFVIQRRTGTAMFLLANAVDDLDMGITHAIRGEDLVNTVPKVLLLMKALGAPADITYAHLPLLVNERRKKLSKRDGVVAVEDYRAQGFVAPALANYLATLGWGAPDGVEIRPMSEIIELFRLEDVTKAPAFFDVKKLSHVNGEYLRAMAPADFVDLAQPWLTGPLAPWPAEAYDPAVVDRLVGDMQERTKVLAEVPGWLECVFVDEVPVDETAWAKAVVKNEWSGAVLDATIAAYETCAWEPVVLHEQLTAVVEGQGMKLGKAQAPVRVAVTGRTVSLPLFDLMEVLGRDRTLGRLRAARARLG